MYRWFVPAAAVAAAVAIITAGCASAGATGLGSSNGAAGIVPANAVAFVAASTDLASSRWHGVAKPFLSDFQTYAPALGDELDVALLPNKQVVALTQPHDEAKLAALAAKHGATTRTIDGWTAIAKTSSALDAVANASRHLDDSNVFTAAMNRLPADALVRAYANGDETAQLLSSLSGALRHSDAFAAANGFTWAAAALTSEQGGLRLQAFAQPDSSSPHASAYRSTLVDEIPSGVLAVADFRVAAGSFTQSPLSKLLGASAAQAPADLDALLGGETAIYVRPGVPIPEVTLVTHPVDTAAAVQALASLRASLSATSPLHGLALVHGTVDGAFVVSTSQRGVDDFGGAGAKLSSDQSFQQAEKQAGSGDETTGFVYANVKDALPFLQLAGVKLPQGLPNIGTVFAYGAQSNGESTLSAFMSVG